MKSGIAGVHMVSDETQRAMMNLLEDFIGERKIQEKTQRATSNILEDFEREKELLEESQAAAFNILADIEVEARRLQQTQNAALNVLDDFEGEKGRMEESQRAAFNILEDFEAEKIKLERAESELAQRAEDLGRSNADLERFAHVVSHDLQEPLRSITGYVQLMETSLEGKLEEAPARYLSNALEGAERMRLMIMDLLAFARAGRSEHPFAPVDLNDVLAEAMANLSASIVQGGANVTTERLPAVTGDRSQLVQVLQNLLANGLKFRGQNPPQIGVRGRREGSLALISVQDNGIGIDTKDQPRLFVPFQRLHTQTEYPGSGIGLSQCRRIVERHGGRIWLESQPGLGSIFTFSIPLENAT